MKLTSATKALTALLLTGGLLFGGLTYANYDSSSDGKRCHTERQQQGWNHKSERHHGGPMAQVKHLIKKLDLSEEQETQVRSILETAKPEFKANLQAIRSNHQQLHSLIRGDQFDQKDVQATANSQARLAKELTVLGARVHADIFKVLSEEQREEAQRLIAKKHNRHKMNY